MTMTMTLILILILTLTLNLKSQITCKLINYPGTLYLYIAVVVEPNAIFPRNN